MEWRTCGRGTVYCKPHVIRGNRGKSFVGEEGHDYFLTRQDLEEYVRRNAGLMTAIWHELANLTVKPIVKRPRLCTIDPQNVAQRSRRPRADAINRVPIQRFLLKFL